jgi:hypothetical protein
LLLLLPSPGAEQLTEGNVLPERERRFLGCIRLSLAALYQAEVVDGVFKVSEAFSRGALASAAELTMQWLVVA